MAETQPDAKALIPSLLESTTTAYITLGKGILALDQLNNVSELLESVIRSLKEEHGKYEDLLKELSVLAGKYKKLDVETKSHIRTVKEQAQMNTKIIEEAKRQMLKGNKITNYFVEIEATAKELQASSEELRKKYDVIIDKVKECCSKAKAVYERNEYRADLAETTQGSNVNLVGGTDRIFATWQGTTNALDYFGFPSTQADGCLGFVNGSGPMFRMTLSLHSATAENPFRKYAEKFKVLDETISQIDQVLLGNFEVLTEVCRLLNELKKAVHGLAEIKPLVRSNQTAGSESVAQNSETGTPSDDDMNIDFLVGLKFDLFKKASEKLEQNCDYLLNDMPLNKISTDK